ncbi:MAG: hypothetical protein EOO41_00195 [Methanobacteriota archaeon]|nr:MAG: hypothetical protein EOO41_00195 [Euryarchaeota archaeon]
MQSSSVVQTCVFLVVIALERDDVRELLHKRSIEGILSGILCNGELSESERDEVEWAQHRLLLLNMNSAPCTSMQDAAAVPTCTPSHASPPLAGFGSTQVGGSPRPGSRSSLSSPGFSARRGHSGPPSPHAADAGADAVSMVGTSALFAFNDATPGATTSALPVLAAELDPRVFDAAAAGAESEYEVRHTCCKRGRMCSPCV